MDSCGHCSSCEHSMEMFCSEGVTYSFNSPDKHLGGMTFGGFSKSYVCKESATLKMPKNIDVITILNSLKDPLNSLIDNFQNLKLFIFNN